MRLDRLVKLHPSTQRELQSFKLRQMIRKHVYPFSPHYRALFDQHGFKPEQINSVEDLRRLPFTTKADLITKGENDPGYRNMILQPSPELIKKHWPLSKKLGLLMRGLISGKAAVKQRLQDEYKPVWFTATTGRSAEQVLFFYTPWDITNLAQSGRRLMKIVGCNPDTDRVINIFPYAPHLAYWQTYYAALASRALAVSTGGGKVTPTLAHIKLIQRIKPAVLVGVPSYTCHLLRCAVEEGATFTGLQRIVLGAEKVPAGMKERMLEMLGKLGCEPDKMFIMGTYGFTEAKRAWAEWPGTMQQESSGYYTWPDMDYFEVINPDTGEHVDEGETGELVYTSLDARGSVVLRYRTGDIAVGGMTLNAPCPHSGWRVPRINTTITRSSNQKDVQLTKVKGTLVNLDAVAHVLMGSKEIEEWAVEIRKVGGDRFGLDEVVLYAAAADGHTPDDELKRLLSDRMTQASEITPNVIIFHSLREMIEKIGLETEMKEKRFFDTRPTD
ncbi:MAG: phenylacetate--CoA ligase family protein [Planctomycetota bacterium]